MRYIVAMPSQTPIRSIGIIMDGNRRWAKARGLPSLEGHRQGYEALKRLSKDATRMREVYGLEYVTLFAFSTENWQRSAEEVSYLMDLFGIGIDEMMLSHASDIRIRIVGDRERFSKSLQDKFSILEEKTKDNAGTTVSFALSYGGRAEILHAAGELAKSGEEWSEENFSKHLWATGIPDPDLIIRTSGEQRISGFLTWQGVYSELFFTETLWPDFSVEELEKIFAEFYERERRHGK